jgi:hypothetical protein
MRRLAVLATAVGTALALPSFALAQTVEPTITLPATFSPTGFISKVLTDYWPHVLAIALFGIFAGILAAAKGKIGRLFGSRAKLT